MTKIDELQLPLRKTHKITGTDPDMIDILLDLKIRDMNPLLSKLSTDNAPMLAVVKMPQWDNMIMVLMFMPPDIWLDFDNQKYQIYIAPNLNMMIHHFADWRMRSRDTFEIELLTKIIEYLESHLMNQRVSHMW